jgi:hypothetical protein
MLQAKIIERQQSHESACIGFEASLNDPASYDWEWAKNTEQAITQVLARPINIVGVENLPSANSIQCGGMLCKVEVRFDNPNDIDSYNAILVSLSGDVSDQVSGLSAFSSNNGDGSVTHSFYLKRQTIPGRNSRSSLSRKASRLN